MTQNHGTTNDQKMHDEQHKNSENTDQQYGKEYYQSMSSEESDGHGKEATIEGNKNTHLSESDQ